MANFTCKTLDDFFTQYGEALGQKARALLNPLHIPARDRADVATLLRRPFEAQAHVIQAAVKALRRQKAVQIVAEMGAGKSLIALGICQTHARPASGYRALVVCPGQLVKKWQREIEQTIPEARVRIIESYKDVMPLADAWREERRSGNGAPRVPTWHIIGRDRCKLSCTWQPVFVRRAVHEFDEDGFVSGSHWLGGASDEGCNRCPRCGQVLTDAKGELLSSDYLGKSRQKCRRKVVNGAGKEVECGEQLWQEVPKPRRYAPARIIQKKLKGYFDYLIGDEIHEFKAADSIQADALGGMASAARKVIALTGTLVGGYAWHVRTLLYRIGAAGTLVEEDFGWKDEMKFNRAYGRIETKITSDMSENERDGHGHKMARGNKNSARKVESVRPGIMPTMFKHLLPNSVFLGLGEVAANLPPFKESVVEVALDAEQASAYKAVDKRLTEAIKEIVRRGNKKLLGTMLNVLLCYPDYPFGWGMIGYTNRDESGRESFVPVIRPESLDPSLIRPKEKALVETVLSERLSGRQSWVYATYTDKRDCLERLEKFLKREGLRVNVMRSNVKPEEREAWIERHGKQSDVILSHPDLVKTGLDFFSKSAGHNFATILFYQTGYNLFTLRQAARRAWRIGQKRECRVMYFYYEKTMQARAMALMGKKLTAAQALEGKFSSDGLAALSGDDDNMEMALAKSLAENIHEDADAARAWDKLTDGSVSKKGFRNAAPAKSADDVFATLANDFAALGISV